MSLVTNSSRCPECDATYTVAGDCCAARFETLLALDHSRQEPWGSRHGQAFAAFALQHPVTHAASLDHAWLALHRIYVAGTPPAQVFGTLVAARGALPSVWGVPRRPARPVGAPAVTIADLGDFGSASYAERLDAWCRAALAAWGAHEFADRPTNRRGQELGKDHRRESHLAADNGRLIRHRYMDTSS